MSEVERLWRDCGVVPTVDFGVLVFVFEFSQVVSPRLRASPRSSTPFFHSHLHVPPMKLTLRQHLRPFCFHAWFSRFQDCATLVVLLAVQTHSPDFSRPTNTRPQVLNKVAGIYGLIALLTGAGGNATQLTLIRCAAAIRVKARRCCVLRVREAISQPVRRSRFVRARCWTRFQQTKVDQR